MSMRKLLVFALLFTSTAALAQSPNLGKPLAPADIAAWDISVAPDGIGLPPGRGDKRKGVPR